MVFDTILYDLLEVKPNATQKDISKAVRIKSLEHHPDRGGSHEMMQKINAARQILTDPDKRELYDRIGWEQMQSHIDDSAFPIPRFAENRKLLDKASDQFLDEYACLFSIFDIFKQKNESYIKHSLKVSLEELYSGATRTVSIDRDIVCVECNGTGCHDRVSYVCNNCEGTGLETLTHQMGPVIQHIRCTCSLCNGDGQIIHPENRCKTCDGKKLCQQKKELDVHIAHGSQHSETIKFIGEGNQTPNGETGTVYVILEQEPHATFARKDDDLIMNMEINLTESLCGFQRTITLLDGHNILINHPHGKPIVPDSYRCLKGYGMQNRHTHTNGDVIIHFDVKFPEENFIQTENQLKQLEEILPPRMGMKLESTEHYEEVKMMEYDSFEENSHCVDPNLDGEPEGVQCTTQ
ncbi:unnamed protein product [Rotaria magnacalcarata]|uniref:Uncharacterized protein n=4 Tax=Rotaria magnacalcarata TaxID=392030 RepID=A0A816MLV6_9BILA|nr:unnamed protein product [Rotaria magnacalcarata]CAF3809895.1 unnamed protein product [Rotaria magnacalcarata]